MEKNIRCLVSALEESGIRYDFVDREHNLIKVYLPEGIQYFELNKTPFNSEVLYCICKDKMHSYEILRECINMPLTQSYLDPAIPEEYRQYSRYDSVLAVIDAAIDEIGLPMVVKSNQGALGVNVNLCQDRDEVLSSFRAIFNNQSKDYDYVALAQAFVPTEKEYRLICLFGEPCFAYQRGTGNFFNARYWDNNETAELVSDQALIDELYQFVRPVFEHMSMGLVGFDIVISQQGQPYLIELNASPKFNNVIDSSGERCVIDMYARAIELFRQQTR